MLVDNAELRQMLPHILLYLVAFTVRGTGTGYKNNIVRSAHVRSDIRKSRSNQSAAVISLDCFADLF